MERTDGRQWKRRAGGGPGALALLALCAAVYLPGLFSIPAVDRDEARFAQASRQMFEAAALPEDRLDPRLHSGGWALPMLGDKPRLNKPPLVYWLQVGAAWGFTGGDPARDAVWMYRLPSVLSALVAMLATWRFGARWFDPRAAWLAAATLAVAPMVVWDAHQARSDQLLLACTTVCMGALGEVWRQARRPRRSTLAWALVFWLAMAAGVMTKGFITPMVAGFALLAMCAATRRWRWALGLRPAIGAGIVAACVAPWLLAIADRQGGLGAYADEVWREFFVRGAAGSREGHWAPPGAHLVMLTALFWPGSMLTLAGIARAWRRARGPSANARGIAPLRAPWRGRRIEVFLLAWIVPAWVVFELSPAKLPHYTVPLLPPIALLSARMVFAAAAASRRGAPVMPTAGRLIWFLVGAAPIVAVAIAAAASMLGIESAAARLAPGGWRSAATLLAGIAALGALIAGLRSVSRGGPIAAQAWAMLAGAGLLAPALQWWMPALAPGAAAARLGAIIASHDPSGTRPIATALHEDSAIFATRARARRAAPPDLDAWLRDHPGGLIICTPGEARDLGAQSIGGWSGPLPSGGSRSWVVAERGRAP